MPNGNEGDMYRAILNKIKDKMAKAVDKRLVLRAYDKSKYEGYCMAMEEVRRMIEEYEEEAAAIVQYYDGDTGQWMHGAPYQYRFK